MGLTQMRKYRIKEIWKTLQGEGVMAGRAAVFVRFVGCNMWSGYEQDRNTDARRNKAACPIWCDTDFTKENSHFYTAEALVNEMCRIGGKIRFCVLTGGEPLLQADAALIQALHQEDFEVAIETNGTLSLKDTFTINDQLYPPDWIVCSLKLPDEQLRIEYCDELKLVVPDYLPAQYPLLAERIRTTKLRPALHLPTCWLQPEDGTRKEAAQYLAIQAALEHPTWRVSVQTHKILDIP